MAPGPRVVRVRGFYGAGLESAEEVLRRTIDEQLGPTDSPPSDEYQITFVPSCDHSNELVAIVDFHHGLPDFLSALQRHPQGSWQLAVRGLEDDLSFDMNFVGFTQLYEPDPSRAIRADIVAICGIDGHAYGSWQGRGSTRRMWLRHFFSKDIPDCRVMTYGYDSKLATRGFATLEDYSRTFLEELKEVRGGEAQRRPLIFIAHSFGGIILARSLIKAAQTGGPDHDFLASINQSTSGVVFFAVPHRGIDIEDMRQIMSTEKHPRTGLLHQINTDSSLLQDQLAELKNVLWGRRVLSFYETHESQRLQRGDTGTWARTGEYFAGLDPGHAILELPAQIETLVALQSDHSNIVKFDDRYATGYTRTRSFLRELLQKAPEVVQKQPSQKPRAAPQPCWIVPFERNPQFLGRADLLKKLEMIALSDNQPSRYAVYGLGGVGKTQLLLELAYRVRERSPDCSIIWIPTTNKDSFMRAYLTAAQRLGLKDQEQDTARENQNITNQKQNTIDKGPLMEREEDAAMLTNVMKSLQKHLSQDAAGRWLLIYDNADDMDMWFRKDNDGLTSTALKNSIPKSSKGRVIFTTRDKKIAVKLASQNVMRIPEQDSGLATQLARNSLLDTASLTDYDIEQLAAQLTYLPLAIVQATAYMNENGLPVPEYLSIFQNQDQGALELLSEDIEQHGRYSDTKNPVAKTWLVSFNQIQARCSLAIDYLAFMSCVNPKDIPFSLLPSGNSPKEQMEAIGILDAYSFITRQSTNKSLSLHRLVHLATRNWLTKEGLLQSWIDKSLSHIQRLIPVETSRDRDTWRSYLPHVHYVLDLKRNGGGLGQYSYFLWKYGGCLHAEGRYEEAEQCFREALKVDLVNLGPENKRTLADMDDLAWVLRRQGRYREAEELQIQVTTTRSKVLGPEHRKTLSSISHQVKIQIRQGKFVEAEKSCVQVCKTKEKVLGAEHTATLVSMGDLAFIYLETGQFRKAEQLLLELMKTNQAVLGFEHPNTLNARHDLTQTYRFLDEPEKAEKMCAELLKRSKALLGANHPDTLSRKGLLGRIYLDLNRLEESEQLSREVWEKRKVVLGAEHPSTLSSKDHLAEVWNIQGRYEDAGRLHVEVLEARKQVLGAEHHHTLVSMHNVACVHWKQRRPDEALSLMRSVKDMSIQSLGEAHPDTIVTKEILREWEKSLQNPLLYEESLQISNRQDEIMQSSPLLVEDLQGSQDQTGETSTLMSQESGSSANPAWSVVGQAETPDESFHSAVQIAPKTSRKNWLLNAPKELVEKWRRREGG